MALEFVGTCVLMLCPDVLLGFRAALPSQTKVLAQGSLQLAKGL